MTAHTGRRSDTGLTNDQIALIVIGCGAVGLLVSRRHEVLRQLQTWLVNHHVVLTPGSAAVDIPHLGGLDSGRVLIAGGAALILIVIGRIAYRSRNRSMARQTRDAGATPRA